MVVEIHLQIRSLRRKLRKQLIILPLLCDTHWHRLSNFLRKAKELQKLNVVWELEET